MGNNHLEIHYCKQCRWLLRATWISQELLTTFADEIGELTLKPGTGGVFEVSANGNLIWSREKNGGFPELKVLKQLVRNEIAPQKQLGHSEQ